MKTVPVFQGDVLKKPGINYHHVSIFPKMLLQKKKRAEENTARQVIFSSLDFSMHLKFSLITNHSPSSNGKGMTRHTLSGALGPTGDQEETRGPIAPPIAAATAQVKSEF